MFCRLLVMMLATVLLGMTFGGCEPEAENLLQNGSFEGEWRPNQSTWKKGTATAEGEAPMQWEDVSTWSGASTRYTRIPGADGKGHAVRLEVVKAEKPSSRLQFRSALPVTVETGKAYAVRARLRSPSETVTFLEIRRPSRPHTRFWKVALRTSPEWKQYAFEAEPAESGEGRFFVWFQGEGAVEVDELSVSVLPEGRRASAQPPMPIRGVRCVRTRGDLIRHSDIIAMYQDQDIERLKRYRIDIVAWGGQLRADPKTIAKRRELIQKAHAAGVRYHAVDCALVQEGGRCMVAQGDRSSPDLKLFWQLRKDNAGTLKTLKEAGVDLTKDCVLDVDGDWQCVPWLRKRWRIPLASVYSPTAHKWFLEQMDAIGATGASALHFDEPGMGAYGVTLPSPGDFSDHAMAAFRDWLKKQPTAVWKKAGAKSLDGFDYRQFVRDHGGNAKNAPLWREFVRFQLFTTAEHVRELRDRVRKRVGKAIPLSMNANPGSWIKLPFLAVQDYMTTEVAHEAKSRKPPTDPLLVYKLGDAFRQPVATTAHGHDWYEMKTDQHPVLVSTWLAMGYALGHQPMMPYKAWVMDPVKGSDTYWATSEHYRCMAHFIKKIAPLLDGREPVAVVIVAVSCDAIEKDRTDLKGLVRKLADENTPFSMAVEGNDLLARQIKAESLAGCSAIVIASPTLLSGDAQQRVRKCAGGRPVLEYYCGPLPGCLPRPICVDGAENVWVLPRMVPGDAKAPVAVHLLNREYDPKKYAMVGKTDFTVVLDAKLFGGRKLTSATLHQPRLSAKFPSDGQVATSVPIAVKQAGGTIELKIPALELWGVVELK